MITRITKRPPPRFNALSHQTKLVIGFAIAFLVLLWYTSTPPPTSMAPPVRKILKSPQTLNKTRPTERDSGSSPIDANLMSSSPQHDAWTGNWTSSVNGFGDSLWSQLVIEHDQSPKDLFISPLSIALSCMLLANGVQGLSQTEVFQALYFPSKFSLQSINSASLNVVKELSKSDKLLISNSIWASATAKLKFGTSFEQTLAKYYHAVSRVTDSVSDVNKWVYEHTKGKIDSVLLGQMPQFVLVNTFYFKSDWKYQFKQSRTKPRPFYPIGTYLPIMVNTMVQTGSFQYFRSAEYEAIRLPYSDCDVEAVVVLPPANSTKIPLFSSIWASLQVPQRNGVISLPKFSVESSLSLVEAMTAQGVKEVFHSTGDFHPMVQDPYPEGLAVRAMVHKAVIEVDEKGTVAAAVTAIGLSRATMFTPGFAMTCDRPFHFFLVHSNAGLMMFRGIVTRPKEVVPVNGTGH